MYNERREGDGGGGRGVGWLVGQLAFKLLGIIPKTIDLGTVYMGSIYRSINPIWIFVYKRTYVCLFVFI
jgi:hypothetical protein